MKVSINTWFHQPNLKNIFHLYIIVVFRNEFFQICVFVIILFLHDTHSHETAQTRLDSCRLEASEARERLVEAKFGHQPMNILTRLSQVTNFIQFKTWCVKVVILNRMND